MIYSDVLNAAVQLHQSGQLQEAEKKYRHILAQQPDHSDANHLLGLLAYQGKFYQEAVDLITNAISVDATQAMYHNSLGLAQKGLGQQTASVSSFQRALDLNQDYSEAHSNLALVYLEMGDNKRSVRHFTRAIELNPENMDALGNLGNAYRGSGDLDSAIACYQAVIDKQPELPHAHCHLGVALQELGRYDDAMAAYRKAISIDKGFSDAYINLGLVLQELGQLADAAQQFHAALSLNSESVEAHSNLGVVLQQQALPDQALRHLEKAIALAPDHAKAHANLGTVLLELGDAKKAVSCFQQALILQPQFPTAYSNLMLGRLYLADTDKTEILNLACKINNQFSESAIPDRAFSNIPDANRRLKVGFVSSDLRRHPVSSFLENLWAELPSDKIDTFAYATSPIEDDVSQRLKKSIGKWHNISKLPADKKAACILDDQIDILIDLGGHTAQNNLDVFALKPAPVQVSWLGYSATTGLKAMDYILGDPWVTPEQDENQYSERIWRLPNSYLCYSPPDIALEVAPTPALERGYITFGTFNNLTKLTDQAIACWSDVLLNVPESRLLLKAKQLDLPAFRQHLHSRFMDCGVAPERIQLLERTAGIEDHFSLYNQIDIALDPFPYSGTTTTCEALWMGVPVLSLKGDRFVARVGESFLKNTGLDDWVAHSTQELIDKATSYSQDSAALNSLRQNIRSKFIKSPACDAQLFARHMSAALINMWGKWCADNET